jgi:hypothetical protein
MPRLLSDFVPSALGMRGLVGVPPAIAEDAIRQAAIDLCDRGGTWEFKLTLQTQPRVHEYPLLIPELSNVVGIKSVTINGSAYTPDLWGSRMCGCGGRAFALRGLRAISVYPVPDEDDPAYADIELWLKPSQDACEVPNFLYDEWVDAIANGAAARLFAIPKQEWSNAGLMQRYTLVFQNDITRAKNKRVLMRTPGPLMMRGAYF